MGAFYSYSPYESILNNFLCLEQTWISDWHKNIHDREPERLCGPWYIYRGFVEGHYKPGVLFFLLIAYLYFTGRSWYADISETTFNVLHMSSWLWGWGLCFGLCRIILAELRPQMQRNMYEFQVHKLLSCLKTFRTQDIACLTLLEYRWNSGIPNADAIAFQRYGTIWTCLGCLQ